MAPKVDVQYVRYYTPGAAAHNIAIVSPFKNGVLPKVKKRKLHKIYVDPVATFGIVIAVVMLIFMAVGISALNHAGQRVQEAEAYVAQLSQENERLQQQYKGSYDLYEIQQTALAMGLIPQEQVPRVTISVPRPQTQPETTVWQDIGTFLAGLFA